MKRFFQICLLATLIQCSAVYAQESTAAEHSEAAEEAHESPFSVVFKWVNLIILLGALGYLLKKPAMEFFDGRKAEIVNGLERAKRAQDEAKERMAELENRLSRLSAEIAAMKTQVDQEAASEKSRIVAEAQREVDRIVEQSRQEMERIAHGVQREIKESVADVVIDRASQKLQTKMTADDQKRVVGRFIKNL